MEMADPSNQLQDHRIYLADLPTNTSKSDIISLLGKLCEVREIYIPPATTTGLVRNFAIAQVRGTDDKIKKCIKAYNGSIWKGSKIKIDHAKEYYANKLDSERRQSTTSQLVDNTAYQVPILSAKKLRIRKEKYLEPVTVLLRPLVQNASSTKLTRGRSRKFYFDRSAMESALDDDSEGEELEDIAQAVNVLPSLQASVDISQSKISTIATLPSTKVISKPTGGGVRRGFGTLMIDPSKKPSTESVDCCIDNNDNNDNKVLPSIPSYLLDEYLDATPCVSAEDIKEESLSKERNRTLDLFAKLFGDGSNDNDLFIDKQLAATASKNKTKKQQAKEKENANTNALKQQQGINNQVVGNGHDNNGDKKDNDNTHIVSSVIDNNNIIRAEQEDSAAEYQHEVGFAHMKHLKSIFYQEGDLDENREKDQMFVEAQKYGIEIRDNINNSNRDRSNSISSNNNDKKSMVFNFFGDFASSNNEINENTLKIKSNEKENNNKESSVNNNLIRKDRSNSITSIESKRSVNSTYSNHSNSGLNKDGDDVDPKKRQINVTIGPMDLLQLAKKFCRERNVEEITNEWKEGRDKHALDYKRKRKDARKRMAQGKMVKLNTGIKEEMKLTEQKQNNNNRPYNHSNKSFNYRKGPRRNNKDKQ